jgi:hypothetical protein
MEKLSVLDVYRATRCVCKRITQTVAQPIFVKINTELVCAVEKSSQLICASYVIFKKLPNVNNH